MRFNMIVIAFLVSLVVLTGCSQGNDLPVIPAISSVQNSDSAVSGTQPVMWGYWDVVIDTGSMTVDIVPIRGIQYTVDVVHYMQPPGGPPSSLGIDILDDSDLMTTGYLPIEVAITHPFPGLDQYTGADVRGVFITDGSVELDMDDDLEMTDRGDDDPWLSNADGYTRWMNPEEFYTDGSIFTFIPGVLGNSGSFDGTLNAYKYFSNGLSASESLYDFFLDEDDLANRGQFTASSKCKRDYELYFPLIGGSPDITFQYAVIASWADPVDLDPQDLPGSFPLEANTQEAFCLNVTDNGTLFYTSELAGGDLMLDLEIFDWAPYVNGTGSVIDEIERVIIESPQGILPSDTVIFEKSGLALSVLPGNTAASCIVSIMVEDCVPAGVTDQEVIIAIEHSGDAGYDNYGAGTNYSDAPLTSYFINTPEVAATIPQAADPMVSAIDPDHGPTNTYIYDCVITGENLLGVNMVRLLGLYEETQVQNLVVVDENTINCDLDLYTLSIGFYDVIASDPVNGDGTLVDGFEVTN